MTDVVSHNGLTAEHVGISQPKYETFCPGQSSDPVQNFSQIHSAESEEMRPIQPYRQTDTHTDRDKHTERQTNSKLNILHVHSFFLPSIRSRVYYQNTEHNILKMNEPILIGQIISLLTHLSLEFWRSEQN